MVKAVAGNFLKSFVLLLEQTSRVYLLTEVLMNVTLDLQQKIEMIMCLVIDT